MSRVRELYERASSCVAPANFTDDQLYAAAIVAIDALKSNVLHLNCERAGVIAASKAAMDMAAREQKLLNQIANLTRQVANLQAKLRATREGSASHHDP